MIAPAVTTGETPIAVATATRATPSVPMTVQALPIPSATAPHTSAVAR